MVEKYGVTFPILGKIDVKGAEASPVYEWLREKAANTTEGAGLGEIPEWNFGKFIVDKNGQFVKYFKADVEPETIKSEIEAILEM